MDRDIVSSVNIVKNSSYASTVAEILSILNFYFSKYNGNVLPQWLADFLERGESDYPLVASPPPDIRNHARQLALAIADYERLLYEGASLDDLEDPAETRLYILDNLAI
jgi:hypothetical protein